MNFALGHSPHTRNVSTLGRSLLLYYAMDLFFHLLTQLALCPSHPQLQPHGISAMSGDGKGRRVIPDSSLPGCWVPASHVHFYNDLLLLPSTEDNGKDVCYSLPLCPIHGGCESITAPAAMLLVLGVPGVSSLTRGEYTGLGIGGHNPHYLAQLPLKKPLAAGLYREAQRGQALRSHSSI